MKKTITYLIFVLMIIFSSTACLAKKTYYLKNPEPSKVKAIDTSLGLGLYINEVLGFKNWYGHLVVPEFDKYIIASEIIEWNESLSDSQYKGWIYIDTENNEVHISVVIKNSSSQNFIPFVGNGIFKLK